MRKYSHKSLSEVMEFKQMHSPFATTPIYDGCLCIKTGGESQKSNNVEGTLFLSSDARDITEWTDKQADTVSYSAFGWGRGNKGELNGSRGWGGLHVMSQLPAKIPHGHVTSDVFLSQTNSAVRLMQVGCLMKR
jgi:hypothetical protein